MAPSSPELREEVRRIVAEREITSLYQPIVDLRSGELVGCEVLSRGPAGSPLHNPAVLFAVAAEVGLLAELDIVCRVLGLSRARDLGGDPGMVFVNVEPGSGRDLSMTPELLDVLASVPFQVVVEFTERALTHRAANLLRYADGVHTRGNLIAIDDLGADPHSLALVPLLQPDILKLDLAVTQGISATGGVTAAAAWEYAQDTGAVILAEGIETPAHLERALALGATWGQGFLFARPSPYPDVIARPRYAGLSLPWSGVRRRPPNGPFVPAEEGTQLVSRLMLGLLARQFEEQARRMGPHGVLLAAAEDASAVPASVLRRYSAIAERAALVGIVGSEVVDRPAVGVQGGQVDAADDLAGVWAVAAVGLHSGAAFTAEPVEPGSNSYRVVVTTDRAEAAKVAERLARRLSPYTPPAAVELGADLPAWPAVWTDAEALELQHHPEFTEMLRVLLARPGAAAAAMNEHGIFVPLPEGLVPIVGEELGGRTSFDVMAPSERDAVVAAWAKAREGGLAGIGGIDRLGRPCWLQILDLRKTYDVYVVMVLPDPAAVAVEAPTAGWTPALANEPPRVGRMVKNELAVVVSADVGVTTLLGYPGGSLEGVRTLELIHPDDRDAAIASWIEVLTAPGLSRRARLRHRHADGSYVWCEVTNHNALADPEHGCVFAELVDVHAEVQAHEALAQRQRTLDTLAETLTQGVALLDAHGRIVYANRQWSGVLAEAGGAEVETVAELAELVAPGTRAHAEAAYRRVIAEGVPARFTVALRGPGAAGERLVRLDLNATGDGGVVACATDVTSETRLQERLERQATTDALTGCWNRAAVLEKLELALLAARPEAGVAALYVDLDDFKRVNDLGGHAAGDAVLIGVAERLRGVLRGDAVIGRLGGDEFLVLVRDLPDAATALALATRVRAALDAAAETPASLGVAWTGEPLDADELVAMADLDMYREKTERSRQGFTLPSPRSR